MSLELTSWDDFYLGNAGARHLISCGDDGELRENIPLPPGWQGGVATISAPTGSVFRICGARIFTLHSPVELPSEDKPLEYSIDVAGGDELSVEAYLRTPSATNSNKRGAVIAFGFFGENGGEVVSGELPRGKRFGSYLYVPTSKGHFPFKCKVKIPDKASRLCLKVLRFMERGEVVLENIRADVSIADFRAKLAAESGIDAKSQVLNWLGTNDFERIALRADDPPLDLSLCGSTMGTKYKRAPAADIVEFTAFPGVRVSPDMNWDMDPFQNRGWQLNFLSCYWIPFLGTEMEHCEYIRHCKEYWNAFRKENTFPRQSGVMTFSDHTCASRIEAVLLTLYGNKPNAMCAASIPSLRKAAAEDREFLFLLLHQLYIDTGMVEWYLRSKTYRTHNHNLLMARALLTFADSMPAEVETAHRYRRLALETIMDHFNAIFEIDGFIREQSTKYNHWMTLYFSEMCKYLQERGYAGESLSRRIADIIQINCALADFEGRSVPMGDGDVCKVRADIAALAPASLPDPSSARPPELSVVLPESGLYSFKDSTGGRQCLIDISDVLKAHGHHDFGAWQYNAGGVRWISDLGGPYKYTTRWCRSLNASASHTVVDPAGRRQMSGRAYGVEFKDGGNFWKIECRSNVYGPAYRHGKRFLVRKDLSAVSVEDSFEPVGSPVRRRYTGRIVLGPGVHAVRIDGGNAWRLEHESGKCARLRIGGAELEKTRLVARDASWKMNEMFPVESIEYDIVADGPCDTAVEISADANSPVVHSQQGKETTR